MSRDSQWWPAPSCPGAVDADVDVPASKSITNRALVLAALACEPSVIDRALRSRDTILMADALVSLGAELSIDSIDDAHMRVDVTPGFNSSGEHVDIDVGLAGTVMRFLPPIAGLGHHVVRIDGDAAARKRPMGPLLTALAQAGVDIEVSGTSLPMTIRGEGSVLGGLVTVDASASSQFVSAFLLSGARYENGLDLHHIGERVPSLPHVQMTVTMLGDHGVYVDSGDFAGPGSRHEQVWRIKPGPLQPVDRTIEPDVSNALPFLAAAVACGGQIRVSPWPTSSIQPTDEVFEALSAFGASISLTANGLTVEGPSNVRAVDLDLSAIGETAPNFAALAAFAEGECTLRGIGHLRGHETDRLAALEREINTLGGKVTQTQDGLRVEPRPLTAGPFHTYNDHRMATTAAIIGLRTPGVLIENVATTGKTLPGFVDRWSRVVGS